MTRHAIYYPDKGVIVEQPAVEKPPIKADKYEQNTTEYLACKIRWDEYKKAVAKCRTIPVHSSAKDMWVGKRELVEGKDYEVREVCNHSHGLCEMFFECEKCTATAFPLPVKSEQGEEELWEEVISHVFAMQPSMVDPLEISAKLKSKYIITKR